MKKIFYFLLCWRFKRHFVALCATQLLTLDFSLQAQAPQGIPYQAIARNASGVAIANTAVKVRFSIRDSIATGAIKYQETHSPTTSGLGLFSVNVGMGTVVSGTFSGINWGKNAKYLQVELNTTGGTTYTDLGTTQMMSVPYALQANAIKMKTSISGDTLYTGGGNYLIIPGISVANPSFNWNGSVLMDIDGNSYRTIRIGSQIWMQENLKVSRYREGTTISNIISNSNWQNTTSGGFCYLNNDSSNNSAFGKLYNWYSIADSKGLCPTGWHVPSDGEWYLLENYLDANVNDPNATGFRGVDVGGKLKAVSSLWPSPNTGANNSSGFTGLPAGYRNNGGNYYNPGYGYWWTSSNYSLSDAWSRMLFSNGATAVRNYNLKSFGFSVRCLKD